MKRSIRSIAYSGIYIVIDFIVIVTLQIISLFLTGVNSKLLTNTLFFILGITVLKIATMYFFKVYKAITEDFGLVESMRIMILSVATSLLGLIIMMLIPSSAIIHFNIGSCFLTLICEAFLLASVRYARRVLKIFSRSMQSSKKKRTLVIGAGSGGKLVLEETNTRRLANNKVVAFADNDTNKIGNTFCSLPVEGPLERLEDIVKKYNCEEVIIAIANMEKSKLYEIINHLEKCDVKIKRLPLLSEIKKGDKMNVIEVDINDLLCREAIVLENKDVNDFIEGKTIMVTGAGGSIGSELVRQIYKCHPKKLVLFDIYENGVYDIQQDLVRNKRKTNIDVEIETLIGATYNEDRMDEIFAKHRPDLVFHAAAYKHVPLMEDSPVEAIRSNVIGTYNVAKLCDRYGIQKMVLVSTDKAVRPTNVMGATKRFAELIIQYFATVSKTSYSAVRFGNVLGSNGSVIPLFKKQIEEGGPVTVTDPNMTRFFMTIPEAVSLILQSGVYATGGEIFILDMGKPVKILDLAEKMIRQAGLVPYKDMKIEFIGLRPGEKLYEELLLEVSNHTKTANNKIYIEEKEQIHPIEDEIAFISKVFEVHDNKEIKELLHQVIVSYKEPINQ